MSGSSQDVTETRAMQQLSAALLEAFKAGGSLDGYGFALWIIPPEGQGGNVALVSNTPRPRVAEVIAQWMIDHKFAHPIPVPPTGSTPTH